MDRRDVLAGRLRTRGSTCRTPGCRSSRSPCAWPRRCRTEWEQGRCPRLSRCTKYRSLPKCSLGSGDTAVVGRISLGSRLVQVYSIAEQSENGMLQEMLFASCQLLVASCSMNNPARGPELTDRLYYTDSFLHEFEARVVAVSAEAVTLDRSAFYPTSGGQVFDTGWLEGIGSVRVRVKDVTENESTADVLHIVEGGALALTPGSVVRGTIDAERRLDHMQQHSGQHLLSAAFEKLDRFPTVSFHMGEESCTIDLATDTVTATQLEAAEVLANRIIAEDRPVQIRFATPDEARAMGVRRI